MSLLKVLASVAITGGTLDNVAIGGTTPATFVGVSTSSTSGGQIAQFLSPSLSTAGSAVSIGLGKTISSGNSVFLAWWSAGFGSVETYGGTSPLTLRGSTIVASGPLSVNCGGVNGTLGTAAGMGFSLWVNTSGSFAVDTNGNMFALGAAFNTQYSPARSVNAAATLTATDFLVKVTAAVAISLPGSPGTATVGSQTCGQMLNVKNRSGSSITINGNGKTIDGASSYSLPAGANLQLLWVPADGDWSIL